MSVCGSAPTTLPGSSRPSASSTVTRVGAADHVVVGDDVALRVDDEAAALAHGRAAAGRPLALAAAEAPEELLQGRAAQLGRQLRHLRGRGVAGDGHAHHGRGGAGGEVGEVRPGTGARGRATAVPPVGPAVCGVASAGKGGERGGAEGQRQQARGGGRTRAGASAAGLAGSVCVMVVSLAPVRRPASGGRVGE